MKKKVLALIMAEQWLFPWQHVETHRVRIHQRSLRSRKQFRQKVQKRAEQQTYPESQQILLNLPRTLMYVFHLQQGVLQIRSQELSDRDYRRLMVKQLLSTT